MSRIEKRRRKNNSIEVSSEEVQFISATPTRTMVELPNDDDVQIISVVSKRPTIPNVIEIISPPVDSHRNRNLGLEAFLTLETIADSVKTFSTIQSRPKNFPVLPPEPQNAAQLRCTICMDLASSETKLVVTNCGHMFCEDCLNEALARSRSCPNCRKGIPKKNGFRRIYLT